MDITIMAYCGEGHTIRLPIGLPHTILADGTKIEAFGDEAGRVLREQYRSHLIDEHDRHDLIKRAEAS